MTTTVSIRIARDLYERARSGAVAENRTVSGQIEHWARLGRATLDNPDLPAGFIAEALASLAEPRSDTMPFVPRTPNQDT